MEMMIFRVVFIASYFGGVLSQNLTFEEDGVRYTEKIFINNTGNTVEYDVPQHGRVGASKYLVDFASGYNVMKLDEIQRCYVMNIKKGEPVARQVKLGLKMMNGMFPTNRYFVEKNSILPMYEMDRSMLSAAILTFCGYYPIIKVISAQNVKDIGKAALQHFQVRRKRRQVPGRVIKDYLVCNPHIVVDVMVACHNTPDKLGIRCRASANKCVFKVQCSRNSGTIDGWGCPTVGSHLFTMPFCCDPVCTALSTSAPSISVPRPPVPNRNHYWGWGGRGRGKSDNWEYQNELVPEFLDHREYQDRHGIK